jgi:hypothetical protein
MMRQDRNDLEKSGSNPTYYTTQLWQEKTEVASRLELFHIPPLSDSIW